MDGTGGYSGWRWIFILIGLVTVVSGLLSFWFCVDFPDTAKFLSDSERRAIIWRLQNDQQFSAAGEGFQWRNVWKAFLDWKTYVGLGAYAGTSAPFPKTAIDSRLIFSSSPLIVFLLLLRLCWSFICVFAVHAYHCESFEPEILRQRRQSDLDPGLCGGLSLYRCGRLLRRPYIAKDTLLDRIVLPRRGGLHYSDRQ